MIERPQVPSEVGGGDHARMPAEYAIGIDLGTTNSALAYVSLANEAPRVQTLPVPQLVAPGSTEVRPLLPSFLYLGTEQERLAKSFDMPGRAGGDFAVGAWAVGQAADVPMRTVAAAKSWLTYTRVDRRQPILPWNAPAEVNKVSPITASQRYLEHLMSTWNAAFPRSPLANQHVVLTVPASFDASARELTREAALAAGLPGEFVLLEEPQAAVYAWLADMGDGWRRQLKLGDLLLVCDIGGGTTDFTLIEVTEEQGDLVLARRAVGDHLLVGGDNIDLSLAHHAGTLFAEKGTTLDPWQSVSLWHACRVAKEALLAEKAPPRHKVAVLGRGSRLIGKTVSVELERQAVRQQVLDGFFPQVGTDERPARRAASGFRELGLPYEADTAVTRHLAAFLAAHADPQGQAARPTHVLFNGGVFKSPVLRKRLFSVLDSWYGQDRRPASLVGNEDLDFAVARGAAYYGAAKQGRGVRIRGGTARSYYVGIETAGLAIPGAVRPLVALCVVPFGMEEGTQAEIPSDEIGLVVGEPAQFRFFSSAVRKNDRPGTRLASWSEEELTETAPLEATLPAEDEQPVYQPVRFLSKITELGMFELWCTSTNDDRRWKLEFSVRESGG